MNPLVRILLATMVLSSVVAVGVAQDDEKPETPQFFFEKDKAPAPAPQMPGPPEEDAVRIQEPALPAKAEFSFEVEDDLAFWSALDVDALLTLATEEGTAHAGRGCLQFTYTAREGVFEQIAARPLSAGNARNLSFWIKTDSPTNLTFGVVEEGGAFYQQFAAVPADHWTLVSLPLSHLVRAQDSIDASGRLEPEHIVEFRIADLANLPGALGDALGRKAGLHRLWLDDVAISAEGPIAAVAPEGLLVDDFERETIYALAIGDAVLERAAVGEGHALNVLCQNIGQRWVGLVTAVGHLDLRETQALHLRLTTSQPLVLNVTLEEWDNSKYTQRVALPTPDEWTEKTLPLDSFVLETDSADENGALDRDQIRVLIIVADLTRAARLPLTFSVDDVRFAD